MPAQVRTRRPAPREETVPRETKTPQEKAAETDNLLDEIDGVLEQNAEEFVRAYVQAGGE